MNWGLRRAYERASADGVRRGTEGGAVSSRNDSVAIDEGTSTVERTAAQNRNDVGELTSRSSGTADDLDAQVLGFGLRSRSGSCQSREREEDVLELHGEGLVKLSVPEAN